MEEADKLCSRLAIIDHGEIKALGTPRQLKQELGGDVIALTFEANGQTVDEQCQHAMGILAQAPFVSGTDCFEEGVNIYTANGGSVVPDVLHMLDEHGLKVAQLSLTSPSLDDVFLKHTGHKIRDEASSDNWRNSRRGFASSRRRK
jgi:ABC-2 type transport system ATP-binding protein